MVEDRDNPAAEPTAEQPDGPVGGERLAAARREQQISVLEVAKELHLDETKVRALERNEFEVLGAPVFAKGHLRKYAQLVGVDEADVFADYYKMTHMAELPPVIISRRRIRREVSPGPWIAIVIVVLVAAAAYWWFAVRPAGVVPALPEPAQPVAEDPVDEMPAATGQPDVATLSTPPAGEEIVDVAAQPESEPPPEPVADGQTRLSLSFSGDCWTEITDASGQRLFFDMGRTGRSVELAGTAPFTVLFGNAENVAVRVDGADYAVTPSTPGSRTARLTIMQP